MEGREVRELRQAVERGVKQVVTALERGAKANEALLELAKSEQAAFNAGWEPGPPICPSCGAADPEVEQVETGGSGPLSHFIFVGETRCCQRTIYGVPQGWSLFDNREIVKDFVQQRAVNHDRSSRDKSANS
jgi:hypothetical protein